MSAATNNKTVAKRIDEDDLLSVQSMDDAVALLSAMGVAVRDVSDVIGDGFALEEKDKLVNIPFIIVSFGFAEGDFMRDGEKQDFTILRVVTGDGRKCIVTDGSTGIKEQMKRIEAKGVNPSAAGIMVKRGFTVSEYEYTDEKGNVTPAKTFYLAF